ncbi:hypothetical protein [Desulfonema magnum]|uniref:Uncharacterized protein n=1 Tax=Desulfonema magnum TaxID=45655 RepID=A0A975GNM7_9BACT|nr:hypothetical protein [Desulfonema magnum]QTA88136.1 Uncharacterized protein dnm_041760 [Desulfonema magnum]
MENIDDLKKRLEVLGDKIREVKKRLPAHSVKPHQLMSLFELEDEYDDVLLKIRKIKQGQQGGRTTTTT